MKMKMINKAAAHFGNPSIFTLFRSYSAHLRITNLIQTRCKSGTLKLDEALGFLHSLIRTRPMPSVSAFDQLIGALSKLNHYSAAVYMFREMMRQRESMDDAVVLFRRIVGRGDPCDHMTYATVIGALCKTHNTLKAIEILIERQEIGNIKPDIHCFTPIIDSLCKERCVDKALELFQDIVNQDVQPDVVTYNCHGLCKSGRVEEANKIFSDMVDSGISPEPLFRGCLHV